MIFIAHRGNTQGAEPGFENKLDYMQAALSKGYYVEVDVQLYNGALWFGHDGPDSHANSDFLYNSRVIAHAKTIDALAILMKMGVHCFYHDSDECTFTSKGYVWCYPGVHLKHEKAIWLDLHRKPLPELIPSKIHGICGDNESILEKVKYE